MKKIIKIATVFVLTFFGVVSAGICQVGGLFYSLDAALERPLEVKYLVVDSEAELIPSVVALQNLETLRIEKRGGGKLPKELKQLPKLQTLVYQNPDIFLEDLRKFPQITGLQILNGASQLHFAQKKGLKNIEQLVFSGSMPLQIPATPNLESVRVFEADVSKALPAFLEGRDFDMLLLSACKLGEVEYDFGGLDSLLIGGCKVHRAPKPNLNLRGIAVVFTEWPGVVDYLLDERNRVGHVFMEGMEMPIEDVYRMRGRYGEAFEMEVEAEE